MPLGYVPSTGSALTGRSSPRPAIIAAVTVRTNSGACAGTSGGSSRVAVARSGTLDPVQALERAVDRGLVALDHLGAAPAVGLRDRRLDPLDRLARAAARRRSRRSRSAARCWCARRGRPRGRSGRRRSRRGRCAWRGSAPAPGAAARPTPRPAGARQLSSSVAPGAARPSTSTRSSSPNWWQPTKLACCDQVRRADRLRPEAQVRDGLRAGLLRVVDEVALRVQVLLGAEDLDRVLVRADRAVRAEAEEDRAHRLGRLDVERRVVGQARARRRRR